MRTQNTFRWGFTAGHLAIGGLVTTGLYLLTARTHAQVAVQEWVQRYHGPGNDHDVATALAVDANGNVYVTGQTSLMNGPPDYATIKYSSAGVPLWTNRYNGPGNNYDSAAALAVHTNGDVFVTGISTGNGTGADYATIKYSTAGVPLWTNRYNGPANSGDIAKAVVVDADGSVFVTGYSYDGGSQNPDYVTIAYSNAGEPLWSHRYNGPGNGEDYANAVAVDATGNVIVTGKSASDSAYPYLGDFATVKYSHAGAPLWTNYYNGPANDDDDPKGVVVDMKGDVIVTGWSLGDYATIKYSSSGAPLWTNRYDGPGHGNDIAYVVAVDATGSVYVTGASFGAGGNPDYATVAYSSAGLPLWTNRYNGSANSADEARALAVDASGIVHVTGFSGGNGSSRDYATIAYSGAGVPLWTNRYNGPGSEDDRAVGVVVDGGGNVYVTGQSWGVRGYWEYATIKYAILRPIPLAIQRVEKELTLSWTNTAFGLQSAPALSGPFTNISGAKSPYTNPVSDAQQCFRLMSN